MKPLSPLAVPLGKSTDLLMGETVDHSGRFYALDSETGSKVMQLMRDLALTDERALIVVTHDARILEFADRIAHMDDGKIVDVSVGAEQAHAQ